MHKMLRLLNPAGNDRRYIKLTYPNPSNSMYVAILTETTNTWLVYGAISNTHYSCANLASKDSIEYQAREQLS